MAAAGPCLPDPAPIRSWDLHPWDAHYAGSARWRWPALRRLGRPVKDFVKAVLVVSFGAGALLTTLTGLYLAKRAAGLDLVPGVDMLDDAAIEILLRSLVT